MAPLAMPVQPKILILSMPHGAAHQRAAKALREAFAALRPQAQVEVIDTLEHCTAWFRAYYNSYLIPLAIWPGLWRWIESRQHQSNPPTPGWIYRRGAQPLFRYLREFAPDVVIATEVGTCELAAMYKRESQANFLLVGLELMDFNRAWIQPEVDLFLTTHVDLAAGIGGRGRSRRQGGDHRPADRPGVCFPSRPPQPRAHKLGIQRTMPFRFWSSLAAPDTGIRIVFWLRFGRSSSRSRS